MTTYDVTFGHGGGWIAIVPVNTFAFVHNNVSRTVYYRFGINSTSHGIALRKGEFIKIAEPVYFRDNPNSDIKLVVVND